MINATQQCCSTLGKYWFHSPQKTLLRYSKKQEASICFVPNERETHQSVLMQVNNTNLSVFMFVRGT